MRGSLFWTVSVIFLSGCALLTKSDNAFTLNGNSKVINHNTEIASVYVCPERKSEKFDSSWISKGMGKTEVVCAFGSPERKYVNDNVELYEYVGGIDKQISYVMFLDGKVVENGEGSVLPIYRGAGKKNIPLNDSINNSIVGFNQVVVAVSSYPQGADLFEEDRFIGRAPFTFRYAVSSQNKKDGYIATKQIKARWISGATQATMLTVNLSLGENQSYTLQRPSGEGYETDAKFGLQIETNIQTEQQNVINLYKAMQPAYVPSAPVYIPTPVYTPVPVYTQNKTRLKTDCISTVSGRDVFTNCR